MSNDRIPIMQASAPPSYVESERQHGRAEGPATTTQPLSAGAPPPPYGPPIYSSASRGVHYQPFGMVEGPVNLSLNKDPCLVMCPSCRKQVVTVTRPAPGALTCLMAAICLCVFLPCVVLPFCIDDLQDVTHWCPICNHSIGTYTRI